VKSGGIETPIPSIRGHKREPNGWLRTIARRVFKFCCIVFENR